MPKQMAAQEGLSEAHFPCQHREAPTGNAEMQVIQGFHVMTAREKEIRIRCQPKGRFGEP
jgi:hypothetical protein